MSNIYNDFANIKEGQLILIIPVGCYNGTYFMDSIQITHEDGSKSTVNCNHFALAVYSLESDMGIYADTLGWGIPDTVKTIFRNVAQKLGKPCPLYNMCHQSGSNVNNATHQCTNLCTPGYPLQTCSSVCGVSKVNKRIPTTRYTTSPYDILTTFGANVINKYARAATKLK